MIATGQHLVTFAGDELSVYAAGLHIPTTLHDTVHVQRYERVSWGWNDGAVHPWSVPRGTLDILSLRLQKTGVGVRLLHELANCPPPSPKRRHVFPVFVHGMNNQYRWTLAEAFLVSDPAGESFNLVQAYKTKPAHVWQG